MPANNANNKSPENKSLYPEVKNPDAPGKGPMNSSDGPWYAFLEGNPNLAGRMFRTFDATRVCDRALVSQHFDNKNYESRNLTLRKFASAGIAPVVCESLKAQTRGLLPK